MIPSAVFVCIGAIFAALIAGGFSLMTLVISKDKEVSEFRREWIDGLRDAVSEYLSHLQFIAHVFSNSSDELDAKELHDLTGQSYIKASNAVSRIELFLNPHHLSKEKTPEHELMAAANRSKALLADFEFDAAIDNSAIVRKNAAIILKVTWEKVKQGEPQYQRARFLLFRSLKWGFYALFVLCLFLTGMFVGASLS